MTHEACIRSIVERLCGRGARPDEHGVVEQHLASCSDCWAVVELLHQDVTGAPAPERARMVELYGCEDVRDRLHLLVGLSRAQLWGRYPSAARHLAWCEPCGERLATLTAVERDLLATATSDVTGVESVLGDVAARLVIAVRSGWAAIAEWRGLVPIDGLAPAVVPSGTGGIAAELAVMPRSDGRVDLVVRVLDPVSEATMFWLRTADDDDTIACHTARAGDPALFTAVPPGRYVIELAGAPSARIAIDVRAE